MASPVTLQPATTLADVIDRLLDKGLVLNADIAISLVGAELLSIKIRAALASFETAARFGLDFPSGVQRTLAWGDAQTAKERCPQCDKRVATEELLGPGCPWCGWRSARARTLEAGAAAPRIPASWQDG